MERIYFVSAVAPRVAALFFSGGSRATAATTHAARLHGDAAGRMGESRRRGTGWHADAGSASGSASSG